jgi:nucleoside-diphosphate-sugar epimerase
MRILLAGATGVIGRRLVPMLVKDGHEVFGTTRAVTRTDAVRALGATPIVMDALQPDSVVDAIGSAAPDAIIHQLTDLGARDFAGNARLRVDGTRALVDAALSAGVPRMITQSISWVVPARASGAGLADETVPLAEDATPGVRELETETARVPTGVVLRYGYLYGPGTWYAADGLFADAARRGDLTAPAEVVNFVHVDDAAAAAVAALDWPTGVVNIVDDEPAHAVDWVPAFAAAVDAPAPLVGDLPEGRAVSNAKARSLGWTPHHPTWRPHFGIE